jgi:hypothetical protein
VGGASLCVARRVTVLVTANACCCVLAVTGVVLVSAAAACAHTRTCDLL